MPVVQVSSCGFLTDVDDMDGHTTLSLQQPGLVAVYSFGLDRAPVSPLLEMERDFALLALIPKHSQPRWIGRPRVVSALTTGDDPVDRIALRGAPEPRC